jgi:aspartyl-tRNA(Asn)/glutamyl-tRNA(Gln) amidotransferase subunit A
VPDYEAALTGDLRGVRIGVPTNAFTTIAEPPVLAALEAALKVLEGRGAAIVRLELPLMKAISAYVGVISRAEGAAIHARWMRERAADYAVHLSARLYGGYAIPAAYSWGTFPRAHPQDLRRRGVRKVDLSDAHHSRACPPPRPTSITARRTPSRGSWPSP